jgi:MFS family permease
MPFVLCLKIQMVNDKRDTCVQFSVGGTKMKRIGYKHTVAASFTAFVVQAVVNNFAPLLFLTFQAQYGIELSKITVLITANFFIQIFVDLTAVLFVDRIGYRASTVLAHAMCATGLIFMTILPEILPSAFAGLLISVFCYAVGAGLLDITINPIVNSCPSTNSNQLLCLLHSFYCWGSVAAVGISTLFFALFSTDNWKIMSLIWAILPIVNAVMFTRVPIAPVVGEDEEKLSIKDMLKTKAFGYSWCSYSAQARASRRSASGLRLSLKRRSDSQRPSAIWRVPCSSRFLWACRALCTASSATE